MSEENKTVLLAEDNPGIVDLVSIILEDAGLNVEVAGDGDEALQRARQIKPDLILLDIMLPAMDGWEVATRLLTDRRTSDIPIIFLTARAGIAEQLRGWSMPIFEYIIKPFGNEELRDKVQAVLSVEPEQRPELREQLRRERLRTLLGMEPGQVTDDKGQSRSRMTE